MTPPRSYKTRAVILRGRPLGEADRIMTLFTSERGKIDAVAKGVKRPRSHLAGRLEFGNECVLTMHRGRSLDVIVTAEIERALWEQLVEPERFATASFVAEVISGFCEPDLALPDVYALLTGMLGAIAASNDPRSLVPRFSMRLLSALGLEPPSDRCVHCSNALEVRAWLDPDAGGFICEACRERWRDLIELDREDIANLRALAARKGGSVRAAVGARPRVAQSVELLITHHLGRRPKASSAS